LCNPRADASLRVGRGLGALRREGVPIIGSGSFTHDLSEFRGHGPNDPSPHWVDGFADWFEAALTNSQIADLIDYRRRAPFAVKNHLTEEHLLPLYVALGTAGAGARRTASHECNIQRAADGLYGFSDQITR